MCYKKIHSTPLIKQTCLLAMMSDDTVFISQLLQVKNVFTHFQVDLLNKTLMNSTLIQFDLTLATIGWILECSCSLLENRVLTCIPSCVLLFTFELSKFTTILK